jgi:DNA-binding transcriptional ArsR family regulator
MENQPCFVTHDFSNNESNDQDLALLASALGHTHRIAILRFLMAHSRCICGSIVDELPISQSTVSQHLKKLKEAGWITGEVEGPRTCYCLKPGVVQRFEALLKSLDVPADSKSEACCG